jgi:hypothetical protein
MVRELPLTCMQPCMVCLTAREFSREMVRKTPAHSVTAREFSREMVRGRRTELARDLLVLHSL